MVSARATDDEAMACGLKGAPSKINLHLAF